MLLLSPVRNRLSLLISALSSGLILLLLAPLAGAAESGVKAEVHWSGHIALTPALRSQISESLPDVAALRTYRSDLKTRSDELGTILRAKGASSRQEQAYALLLEMLDSVIGQAVLWPSTLTLPESDLQTLARVLEIDSALKSRGLPGSLTTSIAEKINGTLNWSVARGVRKQGEAQNLSGLDEAASVSALSELNPPEGSAFWRRSGSLHDGVTLNYPASKTISSAPEVDFELVEESEDHPILSVRFKTDDGGTARARMHLKREVHSAPTVSELARMLGFPAHTSRPYREIKLRLKDITLSKFKIQLLNRLSLAQLSRSLELDPNVIRTGTDSQGDFVVFREVLIEPLPEELVRLGSWNYHDLGHEQLRELRGMELFHLWVGDLDYGRLNHTELVIKQLPDRLELHALQSDLGTSLGGKLSETPGSLNWDLVKTTDNSSLVDFTHRSSQGNPLRGRVTEADARWGVRLIGSLSREQIENAVAAGDWPAPIAALITEKLCARRNQLVAAFGLAPSLGILPANRLLTTEDGVVKDGILKRSRVEDSVADYGDEQVRMREQAMRALKLATTRLVQMGAKAVGFLKVTEADIGIAQGLISEVLFKIERQIEENPNPDDDTERFVVRDRLKLGFRLGAGLMLQGHATIWQQHDLVYPASTESQALRAGNQALNLMLPFQLWTCELPDRFVLMSETAIEGGGKIYLSSGTVLPIGVGADASNSFLRIARMVTQRDLDGNFHVFKSTEFSNHEQYRALIEFFGTMRMPIVTKDVLNLGHLKGLLWKLPGSALTDSPDLALGLQRSLRMGGSHYLEAVDSPFKPREIEGRFRRSSIDWNLFGLFSSSRRSEILKSWGDAIGFRQQYRVANEKHWSLFDWAEDHSVRAELLSKTPDTVLEDSRKFMRIRWKIDDRNTTSEELQDGYVVLVNRLAGEEAFRFTPELFSQNQKWGRILTHIELTYGPDELARLEALTPDAYWKSLAGLLGVSDEEMEKMRKVSVPLISTRQGTHDRPFKITPERRAVMESKEFVRNLWGRDGSRKWDWANFMAELNRTFRNGNFRQKSWALEVLNHHLGRENIRFSAQITPPFGQSDLFPGGGALAYSRNPGNTSILERLTRMEPLMIFAESPLELYQFFSAFETH